MRSESSIMVRVSGMLSDPVRPKTSSAKEAV